MDVYPPGPTTVPRDLTAPSGPYRRNAWVAFIALLVFLGLYFALAAYFGWTAYSLFSKLTRTEANLAFIIGGVAAGFLSLFMFKAVLFVKRGHTSEEIELTRTDQPRLFEFLHRIADDAGAPRPHRVYVSARVNASVFYDLSILNLLIPSRKNLEIGLGLVNVLSLGEVKAVLAHEFGHFAQRTMAIGRWVYIGQQIAGHIVARRDAFDRFLAELSTWDFRIAWIGWIMRLIVWAIRALVDTMFGWVVIAERALSREMEFQADLVAVSLTGSDALVQALYRLEATDHAMDLALGFVQREMRSGHTVSDVFSVQTRMLERSRIILGNPHYGQVPPSSEPPEQRRLFKAQFAAPPRMWSTHPPSNEREANAKRIYIATPVDDRSAWVLFDDPDQLRRRVTADLYIDTAPDAPPIEETIGRLDTDLSRPSLDPKYRGVYLGRAVTRHVAAVSELWSVTGAPTDPKLALAALYPEQLAKDIEQTRELAQEVAMLEALHRGLLATPGGVVRYRGGVHSRRALPNVIAEAKTELDVRRRALFEHDRQCRSACLLAASQLGGGWGDYLRDLGKLLHYAEHTEADLDDAMGALSNVIAVITADGRVSDDEASRAVLAAGDLYTVLSNVHQQAEHVDVGPEIAARMKIESWAAQLGKLELPYPSREHLGEWLNVIDSWAGSASTELGRLRHAVLDELLAAEARVAEILKTGAERPPVPISPRTPQRYETRPHGMERPRQTRLGWWDRFQTADGIAPTLLRLAIAGMIVGSVVYAARVATMQSTSSAKSGRREYQDEYPAYRRW